MTKFANVNIVMACLAFLSLIFNAACEHQQGVAPQDLQPTLSSIQDNIFTPKCVNQGCHPGGGAPMSLASGQAFNNLVNVQFSGFPPLRRVKAGDPDESVLYLKVIGSPLTGNRMPLRLQRLSNDELEAIRIWIEGGALDN